jgi:hypothetical protein
LLINLGVLAVELFCRLPPFAGLTL